MTRTARRTLRVPNLVLGLWAALGLAPRCPADEPAVEFNRDIRPILSENCYACHGPDARQRKAGLRLDREAGAGAELPSGNRAIVPGDPEASEIVFRLEVDDAESIMPPPKTGKHLTPRQVQLIRRWVAAGAPWEPHWSLAPIRRPTPPAAAEPRFSRNPIDAFILATLAEKGLRPAPEADRVTLIRRLSFDLIGLPPTPEQVERFLADRGPEAYEDLVDRVLASPHFGERLAGFWLDLVRYADSVGYHGDQAVSASPFRDYVIKSFNENKPFDRFTIEQLAGDLLPNPTLEQKVAAGYNRLGMMSAEGGVQPKEYLAKYAAERVRNLGGAWLGATLGCCECHDHKFDPFLTKDFYQLEAFFTDFQERGLYSGENFGPYMPVPTPEQAAELDRLDAQIAAAKADLDRPRPGFADAQAAWEAAAVGPKDWTILKPESVLSAAGATLKVLGDGSILAAGTAPAQDTYTIAVRVPEAGLAALRLEALPDDSLPARGPGRASNGNFVLTEIKLTYQRNDQSKPQPILLEDARATFEQADADARNPYKGWVAAASIDGDAKGSRYGWAVAGETGLPNAAVFQTAIDLPGPGARLTIQLEQRHDNPGHTLGRFRIAASPTRLAATPNPPKLPRRIRDLLALATAERTEDQRGELAAYHRSIAPELAPERARLADLEKARAEASKRVTTMLAVVHVPPRPIRVLPRGNWMDDSGEVVAPGMPACLPQPPAEEGRLDRLDLARWVVAPENPLTARVLVNRLWKLYFGAGLSTKLDDLGAQGDWPSHPELLDWLAGRLIDSGWDLKQMIRLMVTSGTYRQSSAASDESREKDPTNRWLARQGRFRLDAELIRDAALSISGLLAEEVGGPSVKPYQPRGYWAFLNFPTREWQNDRGDGLYRRGLYTHWQRQYLYPSLLAFDAPSREECTADRVRSNTPLQALVLLNDPAYVEAARAFAARTIRSAGPGPDDRLDWAYRRALSRPIRPEERSVLTKLLDDHLAQYRQDPDAARALIAIGERPAAPGIDPAELAAWTSVARTILNLHATITRN